MRLKGEAALNPVGNEIAAPANEQARPCQRQLQAIIRSVKEEVEQLRPEAPRLKEEIRSQKELEHEHEAEAKKLEDMAADARRRAREARNQQRAIGTKLEYLDIVSKTFAPQIAQLEQREAEATSFLALYDEQQNHANAGAPPEAALILAYSVQARP